MIFKAFYTYVLVFHKYVICLKIVTPNYLDLNNIFFYISLEAYSLTRSL